MEINITWNICRVCLVEEPKKPQATTAAGGGAIETNMRHLFNEDKMLAKQIYECSGIMMKPNDSLPEKICKKCFANVKQAINFRKTCRTSDTFLQSVLQRTKSTSMLFKPDRPPLEDFDEDIMTHGDMEEDKNEGVTAPRTDKEAQLKRPATPLENRPKKLCRNSHNSEITSNTDDLIDHELEEMEMADHHEHIVEMEEEILPPTETEESQTETNIKKKHGNRMNTNNTAEEDLHDMLEEEENSPETNNKDFFYVKDIKDENDTNLHDDDEETGEEQHHEEHIETDEHQEEDEESIQFIPLDEEVQEVDEGLPLILHSESDMEDNQAQVSSTVITKQEEEEEEAEAGFIPLQEPNSNLSSASHDLSTEYIIDEYLIDDSRSNVSSENSSIIVVNSKITKYASSTSRKGNAQLEHRKNKNSQQQQQVFVCDLCGNNFGNRQLLNGHMKVHRQEKNHQCELCSKRFITACNLQAHMRIHTGEKPFECQYCGRRFSDRSSNLRHERIHTNEKPFHCNECGKCFSLATTLKKHQKVHTGERSYRCEPCAKSFKLPHQLKAHRNTMLHKAVEQLGILGN